jgi:hypothetical protein
MDAADHRTVTASLSEAKLAVRRHAIVDDIFGIIGRTPRGGEEARLCSVLNGRF